MKMSNQDRLQALAVDRLVTSIEQGKAFKDIQVEIGKTQKGLVEQVRQAVQPVAEEIGTATATYDKDGNIVDNGVPKTLGELYVLHRLENVLLDEMRKQIAKCQDDGIQRFVISQILGISSPNLYRTYNAGAQPDHTIEDYRKDNAK